MTVHDDGARTQYKLLYAAIDPGDASERVDNPAHTASQTPMHKPGPQDFRRGDKVSFTDKYLRSQVGTIARINQRTVSVDCEGGTGWRVPFGMLRHVMDI